MESENKSKRKRLLLFGLTGLALVGGGVASWWYTQVWDVKKNPLSPVGGLYFPWEVNITVPLFSQADEAWKMDRMGPSQGNLGAEGCAVTSVAMLFAYYGIDVDPKRLNQFLSDWNGYTEQGWLYWEAAAAYTQGRVEHVYEDLPSYRLMDANLIRGNPVVVRVRPFGGRTTHFVLVTGKKGCEYFVNDPGGGGRRVPLSSFGSPVEALRFYEKKN